MAEHSALDLAIDHVQRGARVVKLFEIAVLPEKTKIMEMAVPGSELLSVQARVNKYVCYISRKNSAPHKMAQAKILELIRQGIKGLD